MRTRTTIAAALACAAPVVTAQAAAAATTIGSDLAAAPAQGCQSPYDCTLTQLTATSGSPALAAPASGVVTRFVVKHGAATSGIPAVAFAILTPGGDGQTFSARIAYGATGLRSSGAATETFAPTDDLNRPRGVAIAAGERIALYSSEPTLPVLADGSGAGEHAGNGQSGTATFSPRAGELLVQATIEPDADGDGYGDETQDGCPASAGPCGGGSGAAGPGGGGIEPYTSRTIEEFRAEEVPFYRAATIKLLPRRVNLARAILEGFSAPVRCSLACRITTYATMRGISAALYGLVSRSVVVARSNGRFPSAGSGRLRVRLTARARRALRRARRPVRLEFRTTVDDGRRVVRRRQVVTLTPRRR